MTRTGRTIGFFCVCAALAGPAAANDAYVGPTSSLARSASPVSADPATLRLTIQDAVFMALKNNPSLSLQKLSPSIQDTQVRQERAAFDPVLSGRLTKSSDKIAQPQSYSGTVRTNDSQALAGELQLRESLPTGTRVMAGLSGGELDSSFFSNTFGSARAGLEVIQPLLRGAGTAVNLASLRQARLDYRMSQYELRGFAEALVAEVEDRCWELELSARQVNIFSNSLAIARRQLEETQARIQVGKLPPVELAAAQAEVAAREEGLIFARGSMEKARLRLIRLLNPPGANAWKRELTVRDLPGDPAAVADVDGFVRNALLRRPELNQARLAVQRDELEVVKTRNGVLPRLDFFIALGQTGYADSFGGAVRNMNGSTYDAAAGVVLEYPIGSRSERAQRDRAVYTREQAGWAVSNLAQLIQLDVRMAHVSLESLSLQVQATAAASKYQEQAHAAEYAKFQVGKSTSLLVAQAERNLLSAQIAEVLARIGYQQALMVLYRMEGTLLERRGIAAPGREPVDDEINPSMGE